MRKQTLAVAATAAIIAGLTLTGCSSGNKLVVGNESTNAAATTATPKEATPAIGSPIRIKQNDGVALVTINSVTYGPTLDGDLAQPAKKGGYVLVSITVEAESGTAHANPFYFDARDGNGVAGDLSIFGVTDQLTTGQVVSGEKIGGNLAWDIAPGPVTIILKDQMLQDAAHLTVTPTAR